MTIVDHPKMRGTVMVCGKGPSLSYSDDWTGPIISCNEAINYTRRGAMTRFDGNKKFAFLPAIPEGTTAILYHRLGELYPGCTYHFEWRDISLKTPQPTAICAIAIAFSLGARHVTLCGFDYLYDRDNRYHPDVENRRNREYRQDSPHLLEYQRKRFQALKSSWIECTHNHDGRPLSEVIYD